MKRLAGLALATVLAVAPFASAEPTAVPDSSPVEGSVLLPAVHPQVAIHAYDNGSQGTVGYLFKIPPAADGRTYTLTATGATGVENPDAYFYEASGDPDAPGGACNLPDDLDEDGNTETATICPGEDVVRWVVVVLKTGADADFTFSYSLS
ncbi:MAG TPA: hypothetical protein VGB83_06085 [Actinomycetota bacterium]